MTERRCLLRALNPYYYAAQSMADGPQWVRESVFLFDGVKSQSISSIFQARVKLSSCDFSRGDLVSCLDGDEWSV